MIITETRDMMVIFLIFMLIAVYCIYWGMKNDEFTSPVPGGGLIFAVCTVALLYTAIFYPYKMLNDVEQMVLHKIPESSEYFSYEKEEGTLQYLDDSYTLQKVDIHSDNLKVQFKDDVKEPYMEMQNAETFLGKDYGPYKISIYLPK